MIQTVEKQYPVESLDRGMDRSKPRHLIGDNFLWTAENVRFDIGKLKPVLAEASKKILSLGVTGSEGLLALDYKYPDAAVGSGQHFMAYFLTVGGTPTVYFIYDDTYSTAGGSLAVGVSKTGCVPYDIDIYGRWVLCGYGHRTIGAGVGGIAKWDNLTTVTELTAVNYNLLRLFQNYLFTNGIVGNVSTLIWSDYGNFGTFSGGQSGSRASNFALASMEILGNYLILYSRRGISRLSYLGPPTLFNVEEISREIGVYTGSATVPTLEKHGLNYFVSDYDTRNVFIFDGTSFKQIGLPIRDHMFALLNGSATSQVIVSHNPPKNEISFWVANNYLAPASSAHLYVFNYVTQAWSYINLDSGTTAFATYVAAFTRRFSPTLRFAVSKTVAGQNYYYVYETDAGTVTKVPLIETKFYDFGRPDIYKRLTKIQLIISNGVNKDFTVSVAALDDPEDTPVYTDYTLNFLHSGYIYPDKSGKYFAVKITTASQTGTTIWELNKMIFTYIEQGDK